MNAPKKKNQSKCMNPLQKLSLAWPDNSKAAAHVAVRPSVLVTVKLDNNKYLRKSIPPGVELSVAPTRHYDKLQLLVEWGPTATTVFRKLASMLHG